MVDPAPADQDDRRPLSLGVTVVVLGLVLNVVWVVGGVWLVGYTLVAIWR